MSRSHSGELKQDKQNSEHHLAQAQHKGNHSKSADLVVEDVRVEDVRAPNIAQRVREEFEAIHQTLHEKHDKKQSPQHVTKRSVSEDLNVADVKAPDLFQRVKEEVEAVVGTVHERNEKASHKPSEHDHDDKTLGCWTNLGKALDKFCGRNGT
eukprot:c7783_g1_i1 orf=269-727(-)